MWCWQLPRLPAGTPLPLGLLGAAVLAWPVIAAPFNAWLAPLWLDWEETGSEDPSLGSGGGGRGGPGEGRAKGPEGAGSEEVLHGDQELLSSRTQGAGVGTLLWHLPSLLALGRAFAPKSLSGSGRK